MNGRALAARSRSVDHADHRRLRTAVVSRSGDRHVLVSGARSFRARVAHDRGVRVGGLAVGARELERNVSASTLRVTSGRAAARDGSRSRRRALRQGRMDHDHGTLPSVAPEAQSTPCAFANARGTQAVKFARSPPRRSSVLISGGHRSDLARRPGHAQALAPAAFAAGVPVGGPSGHVGRNRRLRRTGPPRCSVTAPSVVPERPSQRRWHRERSGSFQR